VRHEVMMTLRPPSRAVLEEIVDTIFLPLLGLAGPNAAR